MINDARKAVLIDMAYEIGGAGLDGFTKMLAAVRLRDWQTAADQLHDSKLFEQVPSREASNIAILTSGTLPAGITTASQLVQLHEGCTLTAKQDAKGKWEIGWGHSIPTGFPFQCTQQEADGWFASDIILAENRACIAVGAQYWDAPQVKEIVIVNDTLTTIAKYVGGGLILASVFVLVLNGKVDVATYLSLVTGLLSGLGVNAIHVANAQRLGAVK